MKLSGAEILCECLLAEGVDTLFGYPGGAILPFYDALAHYPRLHHVLTRHEQGASHMADGYSRASGRVGVAVATSGPGATNLVTGIATAMMDSSPIVCITGQVPSSVIGSDAFQETDIAGVTMPISKHNYLVSDVRELAFIVHEAFEVARSGRPGPVVIDLPKDVQLASTEYRPHQPRPSVPHSILESADVDRAIELIEAAERPVILAGQGVLIAGVHTQVLELAECVQAPVALTLLGKGALSEHHPLCLGMMGMHGESFVNQAIQDADLLLALGMRFDDRVTGDLSHYAPDARKIHVDIDPSEIGKVVQVDVGICADLRAVLTNWLPRLGQQQRPQWLEKIGRWRSDSDGRDVIAQANPDDPFYAAHAIYELWEHTGGDSVVVTDVGQHQMLEAQYYRHSRPRTLITSGGLGTMGFAVPAAIGAKLAMPEEDVWAIVGDGGFQMTMAELATAVQEQADIKIAIINNGFLGMVRQWQELFYQQRYTATPMLSPDFVQLAAAYGIPARRVTSRSAVGEAVRWSRGCPPGPVLLELVVENHDIVYPMVPAGAALDDMIRRPTADQPAYAQGGPST